MSFGREYGNNGGEISDFNTSWASPINEWRFPHFDDVQPGGGAADIPTSESNEIPEDKPTEAEQENIDEEVADEEVPAPTMPYTEAAEKFDRLQKIIDEHLRRHE